MLHLLPEGRDIVWCYGLWVILGNKMTETQKFFQNNNFVIIKKFIDPNYANIFYQYSITKVQSIDYKIFNYPQHYNENWDGKFGDQQIPNSYNCYGDALMDSLLISGLNQIEQYTGLDLIPTYSYWRFYQLGDELKKHKHDSEQKRSTAKRS